jgi:hypothetical protein
MEHSLTEWSIRAVTRVEEVFPDDDHKNRALWRRYLPHAEYVLGSEVFDNTREEERLALLERLASCLLTDGRYYTAEKIITQVVEARQKTLSGEGTRIHDSMETLAKVFWRQGRTTEAEELQAKVVELRKATLGDKHTNTLISMNILALTLMGQGRWKEAEELQTKVATTS